MPAGFQSNLQLHGWFVGENEDIDFSGIDKSGKEFRNRIEFENEITYDSNDNSEDECKSD